MSRKVKKEKEVRRDSLKKMKAKTKVEAVQDDDFLEEAKKQAESERAVGGELMVRMWEEHPEKV